MLQGRFRSSGRSTTSTSNVFEPDETAIDAATIDTTKDLPLVLCPGPVEAASPRIRTEGN